MAVARRGGRLAQLEAHSAAEAAAGHRGLAGHPESVAAAPKKIGPGAGGPVPGVP
jgi:hypothetical protein